MCGWFGFNSKWKCLFSLDLNKERMLRLIELTELQTDRHWKAMLLNAVIINYYFTLITTYFTNSSSLSLESFKQIPTQQHITINIDLIKQTKNFQFTVFVSNSQNVSFDVVRSSMIICVRRIFFWLAILCVGRRLFQFWTTGWTTDRRRFITKGKEFRYSRIRNN